MIEFVKEIAYYWRVVKGKPDFYIVPQNGERILEYTIDGSYLRTIFGIGVEDIWYNGLTPNPPEEINERMKYLDIIRNTSKLVFSVEYIDDESRYSGENKKRIDDYLKKLLQRVIARSDRELDELNIIEGIQPSSVKFNFR